MFQVLQQCGEDLATPRRCGVKIWARAEPCREWGQFWQLYFSPLRVATVDMVKWDILDKSFHRVGSASWYTIITLVTKLNHREQTAHFTIMIVSSAWSLVTQLASSVF